jgi:uncharacterized protein involved in exopolysaccharide biosynthesis
VVPGVHVPEGGFQELTSRGIFGIFHFFRLIVGALLASACVGALTGLICLIFITPKYTATAIISPVSQSTSLSMLDSSALSGLAALGGSSQMVTPFQLFLNAYDSREVSSTIYKQHSDYLPGLFWHKWDRADGRWRSPNFLFAFFGSLIHRPVMEKPDAEALQELVKDRVSSQRLGSTNIWELTYQNPDPKLAAAFLASILYQTDREVRAISDARLTQSESYLESKIRTATEVEYRESLYSQLVRVQTARNATHSARTYSFELVDGPSVNIHRPSPSPLIVFLGFIMGAMMLTCLVVLFLYWKPKGGLPEHD